MYNMTTDNKQKTKLLLYIVFLIYFKLIFIIHFYIILITQFVVFSVVSSERSPRPVPTEHWPCLRLIGSLSALSANQTLASSISRKSLCMGTLPCTLML